jgi:prophage endopeptidase
MSIFNPYVILTLVLSLIGVYGAGHHSGYLMKEAEDQAEILRINTQMNSDKEKADAQLYKAKQAIKANNDKYLDAISNNSLRLSIPVSTPSTSSTSSSGDGQTRAELDRQTSEALIAITNDGDNAIVLLNSCIDRYNQVREAASDKR